MDFSPTLAQRKGERGAPGYRLFTTVIRVITDRCLGIPYTSTMVSRLAVLIAALAIAASCQTNASTKADAKHFYWSETTAHELDYQHTIATAKELPLSDRKKLLAFVVNRFQNPPNGHDEAMFEDIPGDQLRKLAADTRIEFVDLNGDGNKEIIAQSNGLGPCGGTGNCMVMVLQSTPIGWKTLLDTYAQFSGGFEKVRVLDTFTNGYRDIVVAAHDSACERTALMLTYDEEQYRERGCYHINWCTAGGTVRLPKPEIGACAK